MLQILSLNIEHGLLAEELLDYIRDKSRDVSVFCLQETDGDIRHALDRILSDNFDGYHATKPTVDEVFRVSTYVRKSIVVEGAETFFETDIDMGLAMRCTLRTASGLRLDLTNVYGTPQPGDKLDTPERLRLTRELIERDRSSTNLKVLIGDFSLMPETQSVQEFVASGYRDLVDDFKIPTTRNERAWERYPDNPQLFADYAFVRGEGMTYAFAVDDVMVSDHLPLRLDVTIE